MGVRHDLRCLLLAGALLATAGVGAPQAALASAATKQFQREWAAAGDDVEKKKGALDALFAADKGEDAAEIFLAIGASEEEEAPVLERAIQHLAALEGHPGDARLLETLRKGRRWQERAIAARALGLRGPSPHAFSPLVEALSDRQWQVVAAAIEAIARNHRTKQAVEALLSAYERLDENHESGKRLAADYRDALERLTGERLSTARDYRNWWRENEARAKLAQGPERRRAETHGVTEERAPRLFYDVASRRVIFILDVSGSMMIPTGAARSKDAPQGITRFEAMRAEAKRVIGELPAGTKFNLIAFSSSVLSFAPKLQVASDARKQAAQKWIDRLAPQGETNSYGALEAAFRDPEVDTIYFLSDGSPTAGKYTDFTRICQEVRRWNATRAVKVHTIAFLAGDGTPLGIREGTKSVPKAFMQELAEATGGSYRLVE